MKYDPKRDPYTIRKIASLFHVTKEERTEFRRHWQSRIKMRSIPEEPEDFDEQPEQAQRKFYRLQDQAYYERNIYDQAFRHTVSSGLFKDHVIGSLIWAVLGLIAGFFVTINLLKLVLTGHGWSLIALLLLCGSLACWFAFRLCGQNVVRVFYRADTNGYNAVAANRKRAYERKLAAEKAAQKEAHEQEIRRAAEKLAAAGDPVAQAAVEPPRHFRRRPPRP